MPGITTVSGSKDADRFPPERLPVFRKTRAEAESHSPAFLLGIGRQVLPGRRPSMAPFPHIIGEDPKMTAIFRQILEAAPYDYPVHLSGATGTGKELAARAIHDHSSRKKGPFVPVNCGAIPEHLVESELFGHVKGAFSGACRSRKGRFQLAHRGTLFLDEVADLSAFIQVRLLRALQTGRIQPVGGERGESVSVRVISAANRCIKKQMQQGRFRHDLYYRLKVVPIHLPPLTQRNGDIALLAQHFLDAAAARYHRCTMTFSKHALALIDRYPWPGNIRELQNAVHFAFVRSKGRIIDGCHLPPDIRSAGAGGMLKNRSRTLTAERVREALRFSGGNKSKAARQLGVGRATLYRFLSAFPEAQ
jgi:transcriptional regulator with PAS, ATPase and Fis domain